MVQLHNLQGIREGFEFPPTPLPPRLVPTPRDPYAMDVDLLKATSQQEDKALLCSVRHKVEHRTKQRDAPRRNRGNHALPLNLRKKRTPAPEQEETPLASYMSGQSTGRAPEHVNKGKSWVVCKMDTFKTSCKNHPTLGIAQPP